MILAKASPGIRVNEHIEGDGPSVFAHACKTGLEGIVSKRKDSPYRSGCSPDWLKMKNSAAPAVKREEEEDCLLQRHVQSYVAFHCCSPSLRGHMKMASCVPGELIPCAFVWHDPGITPGANDLHSFRLPRGTLGRKNRPPK
jgi:hypothetical protein